MFKAEIKGWGKYIPQKVLTNHDLEKMVETNDEWITSRTGIKERHIAAPEETTSSMGVEAAKIAIEKAGISKDDIEMILFASVTPDMMFPASACLVQNKLEIPKTAAVDIEAACSGFVYGLSMANAYIISGMYKNVLVIGAETLSRITDWSDRNTCVLFGDGAGAAVVSRADENSMSELIGFKLRGAPATAPAAGMPQWLRSMLLAAGVVIGLVFLAELMLVARRQRQTRRRAISLATAGPGPQPEHGQPPASPDRIVLADYHRLVVTCSKPDNTVFVLRPPGEDPKAILAAARLVLPEARYAELASRLGLPASWPIVIADYDRLVVTSSTRDDTVLVLRPPGEDPRAVLRAARLVLAEGPYEELADHLGQPAGWPME